MPLLSIKNLCYDYPDGTHALDHISFNVGREESIGIIGANGAGKSTLVNHLNGYYLPSSGSIEVDRVPLSKNTQEHFRRNVGVIFQNADDQLFMARIYDDVAFGLINLGFSKSEVEIKVKDILEQFGLWELHNRPPSNLSQGQKRYVAMATVLVMKPSILVLDEPTSDLDPRHRRQLIGMLKEHHHMTKIIVSHDLDFIWDTCTRVLVLTQGMIVADGAREQILKDQYLLESNGLELPLRLQQNN